MSLRTRWEVCRKTLQTREDTLALDEMLAARPDADHGAWEPFAVTMERYGSYIYHLRRQVVA